MNEARYHCANRPCGRLPYLNRGGYANSRVRQFSAWRARQSPLVGRGGSRVCGNGSCWLASSPPADRPPKGVRLLVLHRTGEWAMVFHAPERGRDSLETMRETEYADVAQLVEHHLAKVRVAGSNPVVRSERVSRTGSGSHVKTPAWWVGREARQRTANPCTPVQIRYPPRLLSRQLHMGGWRSGSALP